MAILLLKLLFIFFSIFSTLLFLRLLLYKSGLIFTVKKLYRSIEDFVHVYQYIKIPEYNQETDQQNQLYNKVVVYLTNLASTEDSDFINLFTGKKPNDVVIGLDPNQVIEDNFLGARVYWISQTDTFNEKNINESHRCFVLKVRKADKRRIVRPYLQHIHTISDEFKKEIKFHMNINREGSFLWKSIPFRHPATFDTIAMEDDLKAKVKADLDSFLKSKQYYHRVGRVWKRSFLLYGPSGTGKSSFIAAIATYLNYDVYEINFSKIASDSDLKTLFLQTTTKSVIIVEDLDRVLENKPADLTLSGIYNFMDGVFNSCVAEERVMVLTMNSKDNVDPALLRPGRVDVRIHFPLCDFNAFKILANSYLGVKDHKLFPLVEENFQAGSSLSPAEIGELMIANRSSPSRAIKSVIWALQSDSDSRGRFSDSGSKRSVEEVRESETILCHDAAPVGKEFRRLYGLFRMKGSRKTMSLDLSSEQHHGCSFSSN